MPFASRGRVAQSDERFVFVGKIGKPHGLRGAFSLSGRAEALQSSIQQVYIGENPQATLPALVTLQRQQSGRDILQINTLPGRSEVEALMGAKVWVLREDLVLDEEEEYLWSDHTSRQVTDCEGKIVGEIMEFYNAGASDIIVVQSHSGSKVDIPVVDAYLELNQLCYKQRKQALKLSVSVDIFSELWR